MHVVQRTEPTLPPPSSLGPDQLRDLQPDGLRPFTRVEYERLAELGFFTDERVELLRGAVVRMSPQGTPHSSVIMILNELLVLALHGRARVRPQLSFAANDDSQPEPDLMVVPPGDYREQHPSQALLLIEVSDSSLRKDRGIKRDLYAEVGVPEYWVVDVPGRKVEVYTQPGPSGYASLVTHDRQHTIAPAAFPDVRIDLADVLAE
jgi:Uma2 family endonuclease